MTSSSTVKPSKARCRSSASASWPMDAQTSVCTASAPSAASAGRVVTKGGCAMPAASSRSTSASLGP